MPAATALEPSLTIAWARTVAVVVAVTGEVGRFEATSRHHLRAHVLELVVELDLLGDRHTVLGDARRAERLVEHDVAALGAQRNPHRIGEDVDAAQHLVARLDSEFDVLGSHLCLLRSGFRVVILRCERSSAGKRRRASKGDDRERPPQAAFFLATCWSSTP